MAHSWPSDTVFTRRVLDVEDRTCKACGHRLHVCAHRNRHLFTLQGPWHLLLKLVHCPQATCVGHGRTVSPEAETTISMPWWSMGWDVFAWIGHRRLARHWSVPQIRGELRDSLGIDLSEDAIEKNIRRYQTMLAARHQDPELLRAAYANSSAVFLTIDGLQPEKGHETLYVVRELGQQRVWFAEPLLSSSEEEIRRLFVRAREMVATLNQTVSCWMSDKQEAFVKGIAAEFPGVPHRYCQNHFLRDVAKPVLEQDSHAKVRMRSKVRGLRAIEREALPQRRQDQERASEVAATGGGQVSSQPLPSPPAAEVVLEYCAAVRGILNDDQGGPLHPPGLRMAEALTEVRQSLQRNLAAKKGGLPRTNWPV